MDYSSLKRNVSIAFVAQGVGMVLNCLTVLLLPKILDITAYSYWQLFLFYASYAGFFLLGLNDGVYLIHGGTSRNDIDKASIASQLRFGFCSQLLISLVLLIMVFVIPIDNNRRFVAFFFALYLVLFNMAGFLGYVFQAINETKLFSISAIVSRVVFFIPLVVMLVIRIDYFEPYVVAYCFAQLTALVFCLFHSRDFLSTPTLPVRKTIQTSIESIRVGIKLMLSNIASMLIIGFFRFAVDMHWGIDAFGSVSFALTLQAFFLAFISQAAMVLFPALRQVSEAEQRAFFLNAKDMLSFLLTLSYLLYLPLFLIVSLWLPQYTESISYLVFLMPICVFDGKMSMVMTTLMKVRREEKLLLLINVCSVIVSSILVIIGVVVLSNMVFALCSVVLVIMGRSVASEVMLEQRLNVPREPFILGEIIITIVFVGSNALFNGNVAFVITCICYLGFTLINRRRILSLIHSVAKIIQT